MQPSFAGLIPCYLSRAAAAAVVVPLEGFGNAEFLGNIQINEKPIEITMKWNFQ